jgi:hypothetical protein
VKKNCLEFRKFRNKALPIANCPLPIVSQGSFYPILTPAIQLAMRNGQWAMELEPNAYIRPLSLLA